MVVNTIKEIAVGLFVAALLVSIALTIVNETNTTGWTATQVTIYSYLPLFALIAIAIGFIGYIKMGHKG